MAGRVKQIQDSWTPALFRSSVYLRVGVPPNVVAQHLNLSEQELKAIWLVAENLVDVSLVCNELGIDQSDIAELRRAVLKGRSRYVWLLRNAELTDEEQGFMEHIVACMLSGASPVDPNQITMKFGIMSAVDFMSFYRKWLECIGHEQEQVYDDIRRSELPHDADLLAQHHELMQRQLGVAAILNQAQQNIRQERSE